MGWKNPPTKYTRAARKDVEKATRRTAFQLLRELIIISPVDSGRFVANWVVGLGKANPISTTSTDKPKSTTLQREAPAIRRFKVRQRSIWLSNNLPYAGRLNEGWSSQAPANFVQKAIAKVTKK
ncbi:MAG: HK97 gp10 family phage protein [Gammaproteobacteria bacterium]|nr:HK97 gp10 family phage protein [Gammaproteobacteria bacterium]